VFSKPSIDYSDYRSVQKHIELTYKKEQAFECLWLCFALVESRVTEARFTLGMEVTSESSLDITLVNVVELQGIEHGYAQLKIAFGDHLLQQLSTWLKAAKEFFAQFTSGAESSEVLHEMLTKLVREGRRLSRQLITAVRALKRNAVSVAR
jgi:hypothetical protein